MDKVGPDGLPGAHRRESCSRQRPCQRAGGQVLGPQSASREGPSKQIRRNAVLLPLCVSAPSRGAAPWATCTSWQRPCGSLQSPGTIGSVPSPLAPPPAPRPSGNHLGDYGAAYHKLLPKGPLLGLDTWSQAWGHLCLQGRRERHREEAGGHSGRPPHTHLVRTSGLLMAPGPAPLWPLSALSAPRPAPCCRASDPLSHRLCHPRPPPCPRPAPPGPRTPSPLLPLLPQSDP